MRSALGDRTAARWRRLRAQALAPRVDRPLDALLLSLLLEGERLARLMRRGDEREEDGEEDPRRLMARMAATPDRVRLLQRMNALMDMVSHDCGVPEPEDAQDWWLGVGRERNREARRLCRVLGLELEEEDADVEDAKRRAVEWVDRCEPEEQVEVLTLLRHAADPGLGFQWTERERKAVDAAFQLVADAANVCVISLPGWFVPPSAATPSRVVDAGQGEDETTLVLLSPRSESRAVVEEQAVREAALWSSLCHPNVLRLGGACHVGDRPFFTVSGRSTRLRSFFRSLRPHVVRHKVFIPMVLYELAMALQLAHARGLGFSLGDKDGSSLSIDHVYCVPKDDKVRLLAVGLTNEAAMIDRHQALVDDVCALGAVMADVLLMTQISRGLSAMLWGIVDSMCAGDGITLSDVVSSLKEMLWSRGEGLALPSYSSERSAPPSSRPWAVVSRNDVTFKQAIGNGSFASVHVGSWNGSQDVAIKQIEPPKSDKDATAVSDPDAFKREVTLWHQLSHANIVEMYGGCAEGDKPFIVCEYASGGDLPSYLRADNQTPIVIWSRLLEAARGLEYLHRNGIVHGDIKGNNIVVGADGIAKLIDFGASFFVSEGQPKVLEGLGPVRWKAPECISEKETPGSSPSPASDVYSFGMAIIEAVSGEAPWGRQIEDVAVAIQVKNRRELPQRPRQMAENEMALVQRMCSYEPEKRLSMDYIVSYMERLINHLDSPAKVDSSPALLYRNGPGVEDLLRLVLVGAAGSGDRDNQIYDPENYFLTARVLRRHEHKWTRDQVHDLLPLLNDASGHRKLWAVRTLGQIVADNQATVKAAVGSTPDAIASLVEMVRSELPEHQLAALVALQRLSVGNDVVKRAIGDLGGLQALLALARSDTSTPETKKAAIATVRNAVAVPANRARMTQPSNAEDTSESGCATLLAVAQSVMSGRSKADLASMRVNVLGALRNMAFEDRECASAIANAGGIALLTSVLGSGSDVEKAEAAGALWNMVTASPSLRDQVATRQVAGVLLKLVEGGKGALQEQAIGALNAVLSSVLQSPTGDSNAGGELSAESVASTMKRVVKGSTSAAVRAMAEDCARLAFGTTAAA